MSDQSGICVVSELMEDGAAGTVDNSGDRTEMGATFDKGEDIDGSPLAASAVAMLNRH